MVTFGATVSMYIPPTVADAVLTPLSVAVPERDCAAPLVLSTSVAMHAATPDSASLQVNDTLSGVLFHPAALSNGNRLPAIVAGVRSILMPETVALAV